MGAQERMVVDMLQQLSIRLDEQSEEGHVASSHVLVSRRAVKREFICEAVDGADWLLASHCRLLLGFVDAGLAYFGPFASTCTDASTSLLRPFYDLVLGGIPA